MIRVGPFVLDGGYDGRHVQTLRGLLKVDWPWHVYASGSRGAVTVRVDPDRDVPWRAIWIGADQTVTVAAPWDAHMPRTIAHELGHATEFFVPHPRQDTLQEFARLVGAAGWSAPGAPWGLRPREAFAEWFAWQAGATDATALRPHRRLSWATTGAEIAALVRSRLEEVRMFGDVPAGHTHREGIEWAAGQGLVKGKPDGTFDPDGPVTRGQLATILHRWSSL